MLKVLAQIQEEKGHSQLSKEDISLLGRICQILVDVMGTVKELDEEQVKLVHLPDRDGKMCPVSELCLDDCDWVSVSPTMRFLHEHFSPRQAQALRVRTKRECDEVCIFGRKAGVTVLFQCDEVCTFGRKTGVTVLFQSDEICIFGRKTGVTVCFCKMCFNTYLLLYICQCVLIQFYYYADASLF